MEANGEDPKSSSSANQARRILVIFAGFLLVAGSDSAGDSGLARQELLVPMVKWLRMGPHWIDVYVVMFILSFFANSSALRQHVPKILDDIVEAVPQLLSASDATDSEDPMDIPEVPGLQFPDSRQMLMGLYRNMCLLCVQLCNVEANHQALLRSSTPFNFLMKVGHPQGPLWKDNLGPFAMLSCFMALAQNPANHSALFGLGFLESLMQIFKWHFEEDAGGAISLRAKEEDPPARPGDGAPNPFGFEHIDLRLFWIRCVVACLDGTPLRFVSDQPVLLSYTLDVLVALIMEYRMETKKLGGCARALPAVHEGCHASV
jgi:hypothetical protein